MKIVRTGYILMSVLLCIAGILFITQPEISMDLMGIGIGMVMLVFGIVKLIGYFSGDLYRLAFQFDLGIGGLMVILGLIVLSHPRDMMAFICIALGISILLDGLFKLRIAFDAKQFGMPSWWLIFILAAAACVIGAALVFDSASGSELLTILLGISLLCEGILNLCTMISAVLIIKHQKPDVIEAEAFEIYDKDR